MKKEAFSIIDTTINVKKSTSETTKLLQGNCTQTTLPSNDNAMDNDEYGMLLSSTESSTVNPNFFLLEVARMSLVWRKSVP